jgi:hypothetical protein
MRATATIYRSWLAIDWTFCRNYPVHISIGLEERWIFFCHTPYFIDFRQKFTVRDK